MTSSDVYAIQTYSRLFYENAPIVIPGLFDDGNQEFEIRNLWWQVSSLYEHPVSISVQPSHVNRQWS